MTPLMESIASADEQPMESANPHDDIVDPIADQLDALARARWADTPTGELAAVLEAAAGRETNHDWRAILAEAARRLRAAPGHDGEAGDG